MNLLILTAHTPNLPYGPMTEKMWGNYACAHGYRFWCNRFKPTPGIRSEWHKLDFILLSMTIYDWIFWVDADMIPTAPGLNLDRYVSNEAVGKLTAQHSQSSVSPWNSGMMLISNTDAVKNLFIEARKLTEYKEAPYYDQTALQKADTGQVRVLPYGTLWSVPEECAMVQPQPQYWHRGDFAAHFLAIHPHEKRGELMANFVERNLPKPTKVSSQ